MTLLLQDKKKVTFNTGDCSMPVATWLGLSVYEILPTWQQVHQNYQISCVMCKTQMFLNVYYKSYKIYIHGWNVMFLINVICEN